MTFAGHRLLKAGRRTLKEPLVLFLLIGAVIFGADRLLRPLAEPDEPKQIELTRDDVRQLTVAWLAQGRPAPNPAELKALVDQKVALEIMVREAKALGLDKDDEVIKRRLAQKMDFLLEDVARAQEPTEAELRAWFAKNPERFAEPPRIDFHHLYFALDHPRSQERAEAGETRLAGTPADAAAGEYVEADPFMFQDAYRDATPDQIAKEFGPAFSKAVFEEPKGVWVGPILSGYGWHLVYVDALVPAAMPRFEEIEPRIKTDWLDEQSREVKRKAYEALKVHYTVKTPPLDDPTLVSTARPVEAAE